MKSIKTILRNGTSRCLRPFTLIRSLASPMVPGNRCALGSLSLLIVVLTLLLGLPGRSVAATAKYKLTYSGPGTDFSGIITADTTPYPDINGHLGVNGYKITGLTGTWNRMPVLLVPNANFPDISTWGRFPDSYATFDNALIISPSPLQLDVYGLMFAVPLAAQGSYGHNICSINDFVGGGYHDGNYDLQGFWMFNVELITLSIVAEIIDTTTALGANINPTSFGQAVTLTATVTPSASTGTVTFKDGTTTLGTGTVSGGVATFTTSGLSVGSHSITAEYGGDASYATSTSSPLTQFVNRANTSTALAANTNGTTYGEAVTLTATVTPAVATGTVTFKNGTTTLWVGPVSGGVATWTTSSLGAGSNPLTAIYSGVSGKRSTLLPWNWEWHERLGWDGETCPRARGGK